MELEPGDVEARVVLGMAKEGLHDRAGARSVYASALTLDPGDPWALRLLGRLEMERGRLDDAVRLLAAALRRRTSTGWPDA